MPRENRKRGKKHKKTVEDAPQATQPQEQYAEEEPQAGPSWIVPAAQNTEFNPEAPFGYVDSEVKAYFRTVDVQIREWQHERYPVPEDENVDPNEDRRLFFVAALTEMSGKEKELATDPDCSNIVERMAYSMDDFARRVFMDRLTGSYKTLVKHRFASHVCQTFIEVAGDTVARECRGILPASPEASEEGELLLMKDLILDTCEELLPDLPSLILDPFASHVLRAMLATLVPALFPSDHKSSIRSRRSAVHKARQGPKTSVFETEHTTGDATVGRETPDEFATKAGRFVTRLREALGANEVRALAASSVASPSLQMLLEIEAGQGLADQPDSLSDHVLEGLITRIHAAEEGPYPASDYVGTLLRDPTSSHLLETLVRRLPLGVFSAVWSTYFEGKLSRLAVHPVANFVVAKALERVTEGQLRQTCEEMENIAEKIYKSARTGVFRAMIERAATLEIVESTVLKMILKAAGVCEEREEDRQLVVPSLLRVITADEYQKEVQGQTTSSSGKQAKEGIPRKRGRAESTEDPNAIKTQGAILLQSALRLPSPHNQIILDSIFALPIDELIAMAHDVTASRVLDVILRSPSISVKEKRKFVMSLIGHYHVLVDDRIGSRVGDNCWAFADPYLREKIARSLIPHERTLTGSFYGKFFARNLNLYLLQRDPEQWKTSQMNSKAASSSRVQSDKVQPAVSIEAAIGVIADSRGQKSQVHAADGKQKKRKARPEDEIDKLFEEKLGKKVKKAGLDAKVPRESAVKSGDDQSNKKRKKGEAAVKDQGLEDILGAIKAAPKDSGGHRSKK